MSRDEIERTARGFNRLSQLLGSRASASAQITGLSALQAQILAELNSRTDSLSVGFFARRFQVSDATVSDSIRVLAGKGLVAKTRGKVDARAVFLTITEKGREAATASSSWMEPLGKLIAEWDQRKREEVLFALITLIAALQGEHGTDRICFSCRHFAINCDSHVESSPYFCRFFDAPLGGIDLRIDCSEFDAPKDA
jgi:DNA-binding MarR family transcriptional regulator